MAEDEAVDRWDAVASDYGRTPVAALLAEGLVEFLDIRAGESVLDVGTGNGLALRRAAKAGGECVGVDRSLGMLQAARAATAGSGTHGGFARADASALPFSSDAFDAVVAGSVWQFVGYSAVALTEWRRMLRDGGRLGFSVPAPGSGASLPGDLMTKYFSHLSQAAQDDFLARAARSRPLPDLAAATREVGLNRATVVERSWDEVLPTGEDWWGLQWSHGVRFFLEGLAPEALEALKDEALQRLPRTDSDGVSFSTRVRYCIAYR